MFSKNKNKSELMKEKLKNKCEDFSFKVIKKGPNHARLGEISTNHGKISTPYFVPVATSAVIKGVSPEKLKEIGAECTLSNTYHLHLRPGEDIVKKHGGLHTFMNFNRPIFTDSGGFQAFSLGVGLTGKVGKMGNFINPAKNSSKNKSKKTEKKAFAKVTDKGVNFRSIYDGTKHFFDAKTSMKIQSKLGADIIMAFDECSSVSHDKEYVRIAMKRTHDWALKSLKYKDKKQALYGIIQGGPFKDLREESTDFISSLPFEGIAIGGSFGDSYGDSKKGMLSVLDWIIPKLDKRPRHLLGIGDIDDIFECVERGIDTFDCVMPTRIARRGNLYILPESGGNLKNKFRIAIKNSKYRKDLSPIDKNCTCSTCKNYSKSYLRHLFVTDEVVYHELAVTHNLHFMLNLMKEIRESLKKEYFNDLKKKWLGK